MVHIWHRCLIKWIFGDFFYYMYPCFRSSCCSGEAFTQQYQQHTRACVTWNGPCGTLMTSVSSVGGVHCSFARLIYTPRNVRRCSRRVLSPLNDQHMSRSIPQPLQLDISRKTAKTVPLKLSKYLYKNTLYNYTEQLIGFSLNCCTRQWNSCNSPQPIVENLWYWTWGYFVPPCTNV